MQLIQLGVVLWRSGLTTTKREKHNWGRGGTGGKIVVADQKIACRNKAPLHSHSKQSGKLARSCFSWRFFASHSNNSQINGYSFKNRSWIPCFGMIFFVIEWLEEVNMATWTWPWEQIQYTSSYGLFKTVINEEKRDMRMKCRLWTHVIMLMIRI
jgi:hypothetical protein